MNKTILITWLPSVLGLILLIVAKIDLYQFETQSINAKDMLMREMPIVIIGVILSIIIFLSCFYWLFNQQWAMAIQAIISPLIFLGCFVLGGAMGAAYMNAT